MIVAIWDSDWEVRLSVDSQEKCYGSKRQEQPHASTKDGAGKRDEDFVVLVLVYVG